MKEKLPKVIKTGTITFLGVDLTVHILDDGRRMIEKESMLAFLSILGGSKDVSEEQIEKDAIKVAEFIKLGKLD